MKQAVFGAAVKIFGANAEEYFGHRKNGILRPEVGKFFEARPEDFVTILTSSLQKGKFKKFHVEHLTVTEKRAQTWVRAYGIELSIGEQGLTGFFCNRKKWVFIKHLIRHLR